jgi:hypothetical protein
MTGMGNDIGDRRWSVPPGLSSRRPDVEQRLLSECLTRNHVPRGIPAVAGSAAGMWNMPT